jgi:hypothetical protein
MWSKVRKLFFFVILNITLVFIHIEAFQSPIPWLAWLTMAIHAYILMFIFVAKFFPNNKQSENENL